MTERPNLSRQQRRAAARRRRKSQPLAAAVLGALAAGSSLRAATITVTTATDNFTNDDDVSLREAVYSVNNQADAFDEVGANRVGPFGTDDTIVFDAALNGSTIDNYADFEITRSVTIDGPGPANLGIDAAYGDRHF